MLEKGCTFLEIVLPLHSVEKTKKENLRDENVGESFPKRKFSTRHESEKFPKQPTELNTT